MELNFLFYGILKYFEKFIYGNFFGALLFEVFFSLFREFNFWYFCGLFVVYCMRNYEF